MLKRRKGGPFHWPKCSTLLLLDVQRVQIKSRTHLLPAHVDPELGKDQVVQLNTERFIVPEVLFQPSIIGAYCSLPRHLQRGRSLDAQVQTPVSHFHTYRSATGWSGRMCCKGYRSDACRYCRHAPPTAALLYPLFPNNPQMRAFNCLMCRLPGVHGCQRNTNRRQRQLSRVP